MKRRLTLFDFAFHKKKQSAENAAETSPVESNRNTAAAVGEDCDASVCEADSAVSDSGDNQTQSSNENPSAKKRRKTTFQTEWKNTWPWAEDSPDGMKCTLCIKHCKQNKLTKSGCINYKTTTLQRHAASSSHKEAVHSEALQKDYAVASEAARAKLSADETSIIAAFRTAVWMAKEDIAIQKFPSLIEFQKLQGCPDVLKLRKAANATYSSVDSGKEFQKVVADTLHSELVAELKRARMFSVLIDESTDIAISKHLVVYIRYLRENFEPKTFFLTNVTITDPKSSAEVIFNCLVTALTDDGIDIEKCLGFGSDGAAVMVGKENGVAALMKRQSPHCVSVHCMAHRLNLATSQATKNIDYLKGVEKVLSDLYYYFGGSKSGNRKCELEEMQAILDDPKLKIKEYHQIRWLSFTEAVNTVLKCWLSLRELFRKKAHSKAVSFYRTFKEYKFLAVMSMLMDVLPAVSQFSLQLQARDLDISSVFPALLSLEADIKKARGGDTYYQRKLREALVVERDEEKVKGLTYKGKKLDFGTDPRKVSKEITKIREEFCDTLLDNLGKRFPKQSKELASACGVLAMRKLALLSEEERAKFGDEQIETLTDFFGADAENKTSKKKSKRLIDPVACRAEWQTAKQLVWENKYLKYSTAVLYRQLNQFHKDALPNLLILAELALILPLQTADCERGFSSQNAILTAKRNNLGEESLNTLMTIKSEGNLEDEDILQKSLSRWRDEKGRRKFKN